MRKNDGKILVCRNSGREFRCDTCDFEVAKYIVWWEYKGQIMTQTKVTFEDYVGITGRRVDEAPDRDLRRQFYK